MGAFDDILGDETPSRSGAFDDILNDEAPITPPAAVRGASADELTRLLKQSERVKLQPRPTSSAPLPSALSLMPSLLDNLHSLEGSYVRQLKAQADADFADKNRKTLNTKGFKAASKESRKRDANIERAYKSAMRSQLSRQDVGTEMDLYNQLKATGLSGKELDRAVAQKMADAIQAREDDEEWQAEGAALRMEKELAPDRTWDEAVIDSFLSVGQGLQGIMGGGSYLLGRLPYVSTDGFTQAMLEGSEHYENLKSEQAQLSNKIVEHSRFGENLMDSLASNPLAVLDMVLQSAPMTLPGMAIGRAGAILNAGRVASRLGAKAASRMGQKVIANAAEKAAVAGGALGEGLVSGGMGGAQAEQQVRNTPHAMLLMQSERYRELLNAMSEDEARNQLAKEVGHLTAVLTGAATMTGGALARKVNDKLNLEQTYSQAVGAPFSTQGVVRGTLGEINEELFQNPIETIAGNAAQQRADNNAGLFDDVAKQTVMGPIAALGQAGGTNIGGAALYHARGGVVGEMTRAMTGGRYALSADEVAARLAMTGAGVGGWEQRARPVEGAPGLFTNPHSPDDPPFVGAVPVQVGGETYWADPSVATAMDMRAEAAARTYQQPALDPVALANPTDAVPVSALGMDNEFLRRVGLSHQIPGNQPGLSPVSSDTQSNNGQEAQASNGAALQAPILNNQAPSQETAAPKADDGGLNMQNRDRSRAASVEQMQDIRRNPDAERLGFSRDPNQGAPMVGEGRDVPDSDKGRTDVVVMASGRRVPVTYAVVEAADLAASHDADGKRNPDYDVSPLKALNNGRTAGLQAAWESGNGANYAKGIADDTVLHGVSPEAIAGKKQPVLVRLYDPTLNTGDMGAESNASAQLGLSPVEQAQTDSRALPDLSGITYDAEGEITPQGNADFFRKWFANLGRAQAGGLMDSRGVPNAEAMRRLRAAMVAKAYNDERLLAAVSEEVNPDRRRVVSALVESASAFAQLESSNEVGSGIRKTLVDGLELLRDAARRGLRIDEAIAQSDILGRNEDAELAARFMAETRSGKKMADAFKLLAEYAQRAEQQAASDDIFGDAPKPSVREALKQAGIINDERVSQSPAMGNRQGERGESERRGSATDAGGRADTGRGQGGAGESGRRGVTGTGKNAVIRKDSGKAWEGRAGARKALRDRGLENTHEIVKADGGYVLTPRADAFQLDQHTEEDIRAKEAREQDEATAKAAELKRQADAAVDHFTLGSEGSADQSNAPKDSSSQQSLLGSGFKTRGEAKAAPKNDPNSFVSSPGGSLDFGEISAGVAKAIGRQAGKIRLTQGIQNADGTGYGLAHIEANHGKHIRNQGFPSVEAFVQRVASGFSEVWRAKGGQLLVTISDGRKDVMFVQLSPSEDGDYYRVNSAFPVRQKDYESRKEMEKLWDGSEPTSVATGQQPAFAAGNLDNVSSEASPNARNQSSNSIAQKATNNQSDNVVDPVGEYHHKHHPQVTASVTKTEKGYQVEWSPDDVQEFKGKTAAAKVAAAMEKEGYLRPDAGQVQESVRRNDYHSEPSEAQKKAGNYKKEHVKWNSLDIAIETQAGTMRRGADENGKPWENQLAYDYGYVKRTEGADGDAVDVFIGNNLTGDKVFIVNQRNAKGGFDEHKVMLGFNDAKSAEAGYLANYSKGWKNYDADLIEMSVSDFKDWLKNGDTTAPAKAGDNVATKHETGDTGGANEPEASYERESRRISSRKRTSRPVQGGLDTGWGSTGDLFSESAASAGADTAKLQAAANFAIRVESEVTRTAKVSTDHIASANDAAEVFTPFRNRAQETFLVALLDKNGKVLEVMQHSIGKTASATVEAMPIAGAVAKNPAVESVWFAHNHPSSDLRESNADRQVTKKLSSLLDDIGIETNGHIILASNEFAELDKQGDSVRRGVPYPNGERSKTISITERNIVFRKDAEHNISSPNEALRIAKHYGSDGILLLANNNDVVGFLAISSSEMESLRKDNNAGARRVAAAIETANAPQAIIVTQKEVDKDAANNIGNMMARLEIIVLDHVATDTGYSAASSGNNNWSASKPFYSYSPSADSQTSGALQDQQQGIDYQHGQEILESRLEQWASSFASDGRGRVGLVAQEWAEPSRYAGERSGTGFLESAKEGRTEQEKLITAAKEHGFFIGDSSSFIKEIRTNKNSGGQEHDAYIVGEEHNRVVIRSTIAGSFGSTSTHSPVQYLKRLEEYNQLFPSHQVRMIGVGQREDGTAVVWTAQPFVAGEEFATQAELDAAMRQKGWFEVGTNSHKYRHRETGAIIEDVHRGNVLHIGDELFPIDVIVDALPKKATNQQDNLADFTQDRRIELATAGRDKYTIKEAKRVMVAARLRKILLDEQPSADALKTLLTDIEQAREIREDRKVKDRVRGHDWFTERVARGVRNGDISREAAELAKWFVDQNPDLLEDMALSVRQGKPDSHSAGQYDQVRRLVTLFSGKGNEHTLIHEILHHAERMMPPALQKAIRTEWRGALESAMRQSKPGSVERKALDAIMWAEMGDTKPLERMIKSGKFPYSMYHLTNASEYWAVNAPKIIASRRDAARSWVKRAVQWTKEMVQKVRSLLNLRSDAPLIKALDSILAGDGSFISQEMLSNASIYRDLQNNQSGGNNSPTQQNGLPMAPLWELPPETQLDHFVQYTQNRFQRIGKTQAAIAKAGGTVDLDTKTDPDNAERLFHGKASNDIRLFREQHIDPLLEYMKKNGLTLDDVGLYLYASHAPERNAHIEMNVDKNNPAGSGMPDDVAAKVIVGFDQEGKLKALRGIDDKIKAIRELQLKQMEESGDYDAATIQLWRNRFKFYVPLKGQDTTQESDLLAGQHLPKGYKATTKLVRQALGRRSMANNPLAVLLNDTEKAIVNFRKSEVREALLNLALQNPNPKVWTVSNSPPAVRVARDGTVVMQSSGASANAQDVFLVKRNGRNVYVQIHDPGILAALKNLNADGMNITLQALNAVTTWWKAAVTSANPNFVLTNMVADAMLSEVAMLAEKEVGLLKGKDPKAAGAAWIKKELGGKVGFAKRVGQVARLATLIGRQRFADGGKPPSALLTQSGKRWLALYDEMRAHGGEIGFLGLSGLEDSRRELESKLSPLGWKNAPGKALHALWETVEKINAGAENATRLIAYAMAREAYGLSPDKAALIARKLTVDFNRRGNQRWIDVLSPFFNAGVQGLERIATLIQRGGKVAKKVLIALAGLAMAGYMVTWWNHAMTTSGDPYDAGAYVTQVRSTDAMRLMHLALPTDDKASQKFVTIRMPHEFSPFWNTGVAFYEATAGGRPGYAGSLMLQSLGYTFNPVAGGQWAGGIAEGISTTLVPFAGRPFFEIWTNTNSFGTPVHKDYYGDKEKAPPASMRGRLNTPQEYKDVVLALNKMGGGNEAVSSWADMHPETLRHMLRFAGGGALTFWDQMLGLGSNKLDGTETETKDLPIVGRFAREYDIHADRALYYRYKRAFEKASNQKKRADEAKVSHLLDEMELALLRADLKEDLKEANTKLDEISERRQKIRANLKGGALVAQEKSLEKQERDIYRKLNRLGGRAMVKAGLRPLGAE